MRYALIVGSPLDGFRVIGPFNTATEIARFLSDAAELDKLWRDVWITALWPPETTEVRETCE